LPEAQAFGTAPRFGPTAAGLLFLVPGLGFAWLGWGIMRRPRRKGG